MILSETQIKSLNTLSCSKETQRLMKSGCYSLQPASSRIKHCPPPEAASLRFLQNLLGCWPPSVFQHWHGAYAPPFPMRPRSGARRPLPRHDPDGARSARQGDPYGSELHIVPVRHVMQLTPRHPRHRLHLMRPHPEIPSNPPDHGSTPGIRPDPF